MPRLLNESGRPTGAMRWARSCGHVTCHMTHVTCHIRFSIVLRAKKVQSVPPNSAWPTGPRPCEDATTHITSAHVSLHGRFASARIRWARFFQASYVTGACFIIDFRLTFVHYSRPRPPTPHAPTTIVGAICGPYHFNMTILQSFGGSPRVFVRFQ